MKIYVMITLSYLWYRFILLFLEDIRNHKTTYSRYNGQLMSIIIPFYNEDPLILGRSINSVIKAYGKKKVIVVDDGSDNLNCKLMIDKYFKDKIKFVRYEENKGKRNAQEVGLKYAKGEYLITIDSDTIIKKNALIKLIKPLIHDRNVGATTGNVKVYNEKENFLTRMISARYWSAFNIERKSLSSFGIVTCCSGVLSAYRTSFFNKIIKQYTSQTFLGTNCTYGDDRHLTNLVLKDKYKINYVEDAICHTEVPNNYKQFFKQQLRWKKSFIRESIITLRFAFTHSILLPLEILLNIIIPFLSLFIRLALIYSMIIFPLIIPAFIGSVIIVAIIRNFILFYEKKDLALYTIPYAFVHELGLFWLYIIALFKLKETGWGTR